MTVRSSGGPGLAHGLGPVQIGVCPKSSDIGNHTELLLNPKLGASWESFALEQIIKANSAEAEDCYFWGSHQGAELDLLIMKGSKRLGFEIKFGSSPQLTKSMEIVMDDLSLDKMFVIYPGKIDYPLTKKIFVTGFENYFRMFE